ncbi:MAG: hypothetical protein SAL07_20825 [Oscillatoria sp. PMC 1051.18]|uniref:hypothetical protein n=1 Tax=Oscillatoria salina TaxID=331517 RepID=UPI0013BB1124|nr:hypothetical protein [Oscillatoria salina]MBZ8179181.1 hypothetical protein [Oscillatoria salina IIICB1]MEC4895639.1 hypothetical protein [Oscillatoria sp. PMC 1050.18]MEC5032351.1 hypothetical protein [Oscillatoria sp. PMC 1051.18]NET88034.1 hypothetical protein [Kamptonema sp. SIO1D9]
MPISSQLRSIRRAISPRLAINILANGILGAVNLGLSKLFNLVETVKAISTVGDGMLLLLQAQPS